MRILAAVAVFALGLAAIAGTARRDDFDFAAANAAERAAWLDREARRIERDASRFTPKARGSARLNYFLDEVTASDPGPALELSFRVQSPYGAQVSAHPFDAVLRALCEGYARTALYDEAVPLAATYARENGGPLYQFTARPETCDQRLSAAA